ADKVWVVAPQDARTMALAPGETVRDPRQFGQGWRTFVNQKVLGREGFPPAATLATPRSTSHKPEWNWHGYGEFNQGRATVVEHLTESANQASAADLAPFMKYAHLWHPSNMNSTSTLIQSPMTVSTPTPTPREQPTEPAALTPSVTSEQP